MNHKDVLKLLFPLELEGVFDDDIAIEGAVLDDFCARVDDLLAEMFPDTTVELIADWERVCGIVPNDDDSLQARRDRIIAKLRALGGLSRQYFIELAAALGHDIAITEYVPFMAGRGRCGDRLYIYEVIWCWLVTFAEPTTAYDFRAGESRCGERLCWWIPCEEVEAGIEDLKPAHTFVEFAYS